jgi:hypothetical protein
MSPVLAPEPDWAVLASPLPQLVNSGPRSATAGKWAGSVRGGNIVYVPIMGGVSLLSSNE